MHLIGPSVELRIPHQRSPFGLYRRPIVADGQADFIFSRSQGQVEDAFEMIRLANGLDEAAGMTVSGRQPSLTRTHHARSTALWGKGLLISPVPINVDHHAILFERRNGSSNCCRCFDAATCRKSRRHHAAQMTNQVRLLAMATSVQTST